MKHKDIIIAIIAFLVLFMLMNCKRQEPVEQEQLPEIIIEENIKEEIDTDVPIDYDIEDEVLPEGY
jgi:hypothetical protein